MKDPLKMRMVAKTLEGAEEVLEKELAGLGATGTEKLKRAVAFEGDLSLLYRVNYVCRTALRVLVPISSFSAHDARELYNNAFKVEWETMIGTGHTFAVDGVVSYSGFNHSGFVALKTKDAIVDRIRQKTGHRPNVDPGQPDIRVNVHIFRDRCNLSLDSSGTSLHLRGYRRASVEAPLSEVMAASLVLISGWDKHSPLVDPMCGSGTILAEAAMIAANIPAGHFRKRFGFESWNNFDSGLWEKIKKEEDGKIRDPGAIFFGSDKDEKAVQALKRNFQSLGMLKSISFRQSKFEDLDPPFPQGTIITNPPFGERLAVDNLIAFYQEIGNILKRNYSGYTAWLLGSDPDSLKFIGLRPSRRIRIMNGPLECRFVKFDLYEGSKRTVKDHPGPPETG